jgi:NitT/TauT family transport system substrate-binding protein
MTPMRRAKASKLDSVHKKRGRRTVDARFMLHRRTLFALPPLRCRNHARRVVCAQQAKLEKTKVSIAVGGKAAFYYLPLTISEQLGYFKAEGLDVEISDFAGGARALQAVVGGSADVCSGAYEHTINLQAKNQLFQAFVLQGRAPQIAVGVSTKNMPGYKSAWPTCGQEDRRLGAGLVDQHGGQPGAVARRPQGQRRELHRRGHRRRRAGRAALGPDRRHEQHRPGDDHARAEGRREDHQRHAHAQGHAGGVRRPMPAACLYAHGEFVQKNPNTCQALANAIVHGLKWLQTAGPGDIIKTVPESYLLGDRALYLASFNKVREAIALDGIVPEDGARPRSRRWPASTPA